MACSDLLTMLSYLIFGIYFYLIYAGFQIDVPSPERDTQLWTHFAKVHVMASVTFHSISIWLTVYLACFRCIYLASASSSTCGIQKPPGHIAQRKKSKPKCCSSIAYAFKRCLLACRTYTCTLVGILNICLFCVLFCFPAYLYPTVREMKVQNFSNESNHSSNKTDVQTYFFVDQSDLNIKTNGFIFKVMFYTQAIFGKFVPCLLLTTFSSILIHSLFIINRNNKRLNKKIGSKKKEKSAESCLFKPFRFLISRILLLSPNKFKQTSVNTKNSTHNSNNANILITRLDENEYFLTENQEEIQTQKKDFAFRPDSNKQQFLEINNDTKNATKETNLSNLKENSTINQFSKKPKTVKRSRASENLRTTLMLTIVCILFLITEFPQSILIFFALFKDESFYQNAYMPLGDLFDIIALINNSINFLLYCVMSRAFRNTFYQLLVDSWCYKCFRNTSLDKTKKGKDLKQLNTNNFANNKIEN